MEMVANVKEQITKVIAKIANCDLRNKACKDVDWYKFGITVLTPHSLLKVKHVGRYALWNSLKPPNSP